MPLQSKKLFVHAFALILVLLAFVIGAEAQGDSEGMKGGSKPSSSATPKSNNRGTTQIRVVTKTQTKMIKQTLLIVTAQPKAKIVLTDEDGNTLEPQFIKADQHSVDLEFPQMRRSSSFIVTAELPGYKPEKKEIAVVVGGRATVDLTLTPLMYNLNLKFNAEKGTIQYKRENSPPAMARIQDYSAALRLSPGVYDLDFMPDGGFLPKSMKVEVKNDEAREVVLERPASKPFSSTNPTDWTVEESLSGLKFDSNRSVITVEGNGVALPRSEDVRNYGDFLLTADVKMLNGNAVSFALRAHDVKNYYLLQMTGANASERFVLRGFIVKDGVARPFDSVSVRSISDILQPNKAFRIIVKMHDDTIMVRVVDNESGVDELAGKLRDSSKTFRIGAVGFAARPGERNEIALFSICATEKCLK